MNERSLLALSLLTTGLACSSPEPRDKPEPGVAPTTDSAVAFEPEPAPGRESIEPLTGGESQPEPESGPDPESKPEADPTEPVVMQPVAFRQGALDNLVVQGEHVFLDLGGLPVPIGADGQPTYRKELINGLGQPQYRRRVEAIAVDAEGEPTWITTYDEVGRSWPRYDIYRFDGKRWRDKTKRNGKLIAHYQDYVRVGDSTFGLRAHHGNPKPWLALSRYMFDGGWTNAKAEKRFDASWAAVRKALANTPPAFEALGGSDGPAPTLPTRAAWSDAIADSSGNVYAIQVARPKSDQKLELLLWPPGTSAPQTVALPGVGADDRSMSLRLAAAGDKVLVYGAVRGPDESRAYLAVGSGKVWESVPTDPVDDKLDRDHLIAAVDPAGEIRVTGEWWTLWRRTPDGRWGEVRLPVFDAAGRQPLRTDATLSVDTVAWGGGSWWALGSEGNERSYGTEEHIAALYSSAAPTAAGVVELPDEATLESDAG